MKRALLLYNPASGQKQHLRLAQVESARSELANSGVEAVIEPTWRPGSAGEQVRDAIVSGFDTILACGGDGTVNEALQGIVGTQAVLGVIPLGTGNALANDLGISRDPAAAARLALQSTPRNVAVARIRSQRRDGGSDERYFLSAAGVGADAEMMYRLTLAFKSRRGMLAYYAEAWRQWATYSYPSFRVEFRGRDCEMRQVNASQVLAIRITQFGGLLRRLAPGAGLHRPDLQLVIFKSQSRWTYLRFMTGVILGLPWSTPGVELVSASELNCLPALPEPQRIYAEADGELVGTLPVRIEMAKEFVRLLVPRVRDDFDSELQATSLP